MFIFYVKKCTSQVRKLASLLRNFAGGFQTFPTPTDESHDRACRDLIHKSRDSHTVSLLKLRRVTRLAEMHFAREFPVEFLTWTFASFASSEISRRSARILVSQTRLSRRISARSHLRNSKKRDWNCCFEIEISETNLNDQSNGMSRQERKSSRLMRRDLKTRET